MGMSRVCLLRLKKEEGYGGEEDRLLPGRPEVLKNI